MRDSFEWSDTLMMLDARLLIAINSADSSSDIQIASLINDLQHKCYHPAMQLLLEDDSDTCFDFLETTIHFSTNRLKSIFKTKNTDCLTQSGMIQFLTSQIFYSFASNNKMRRIGIILGKIHSMLTYTTHHDNDILAAWLNLVIHFISLDFPIRLI